MIRLFFILSFFLFQVHAFAQVNSKKHEFRGVWIATIANIDWPSKAGLNAELQKQEFVELISKAKANGMNAVIVQVRPSADAFYDSPFENWSRYLTGKQGMPPAPYYDPLTFMINEAHKQCLEFHAWFNPYRALVDANKNPNTLNHITYQHPEWFLNYGGKKYFDPGLPEVQEYFTKIVMDVVKRYDVDAIHFDDYFYPYRIAKQEFPDYKSFAKYGTSFSNKDDWRRDNVNKLIESLGRKIKQEKSYVKFGISPFGVWRNSSKDVEGSNTNGGQTNYDDLFADVILWQKKGWIDYLLPQLYWEMGHRAADYVTLLDWWNQHAFGRHMYIGHGLYQIGVSKKLCWRNMYEIESQVDLLRNKNNVQGSAFYSANSFIKNRVGCNQSFQHTIYTNLSLLPTMKWIDSVAPAAPKLQGLNGRDGYKVLKWSVENVKNEALQFAIYRFASNEKIDVNSVNNLIAIVRGDNWVEKVNGNFKYVVTALDRLHNESEVSNSVQ